MRYGKININPWKYCLVLSLFFFLCHMVLEPFIFTSITCSSWMWCPKITFKKWGKKNPSTKILRENYVSVSNSQWLRDTWNRNGKHLQLNTVTKIQLLLLFAPHTSPDHLCTSSVEKYVNTHSSKGKSTSQILIEILGKNLPLPVHAHQGQIPLPGKCTPASGLAPAGILLLNKRLSRIRADIETRMLCRLAIFSSNCMINMNMNAKLQDLN